MACVRAASTHIAQHVDMGMSSSIGRSIACPPTMYGYTILVRRYGYVDTAIRDFFKNINMSIRRVYIKIFLKIKYRELQKGKAIRLS